MKTIVIGNGFIASHLPYDVVPERITTDQNQVKLILEKYKPDVVVNTVGFCGNPNVDQCEILKSKTAISNTVIPVILASECEKLDIKLLTIGSGCIYFGKSPNQGNFLVETKTEFGSEVSLPDLGWKEDDFANPKSYYSKTKYSTDLILGQMKNVSTLRIRMPISDRKSPRNFIDKVKNYPKINGLLNSMTFVEDFVKCVDHFINKNLPGIYHVANPQPLSAARVMREYQKYVPSHTFDVVGETELDKLTTAKRSNCILNTDKLKSTGFEMSNSDEMLVKTMQNYFKNQTH